MMVERLLLAFVAVGAFWIVARIVLVEAVERFQAQVQALLMQALR